MQIVDLNTAPQHIAQLAAWHHRQWSYLDPDKTLEQRIEDLRGHLRGAAVPRTFVAIDDELLGSASLIEDDMDTHPELTPWLASVFVDPAQRQRGVGAALVKAAMAAAAQAGLNTLWLFTPDQERFYRQLGWRTVSREHHRGEEVTIMRIDFTGGHAADDRGR